MKTYIFHRDTTFYLIDLIDDEDAKKGAEFNKGTTKVTDINGKVIWRPETKKGLFKVSKNKYK